MCTSVIFFCIPHSVYKERSFIAAGGLISYGPDFVDMYRPPAESDCMDAIQRAKRLAG